MTIWGTPPVTTFIQVCSPIDSARASAAEALIARVGGDEFVVVPKTRCGPALRGMLARRLRQAKLKEGVRARRRVADAAPSVSVWHGVFRVVTARRTC